MSGAWIILDRDPCLSLLRERSDSKSFLTIGLAFAEQACADLIGELIAPKGRFRGLNGIEFTQIGNTPASLVGSAAKLSSSSTIASPPHQQ
jgi:hypothetical protein